MAELTSGPRKGDNGGHQKSRGTGNSMRERERRGGNNSGGDRMRGDRMFNNHGHTGRASGQGRGRGRDIPNIESCAGQTPGENSWNQESPGSSNPHMERQGGRMNNGGDGFRGERMFTNHGSRISGHGRGRGNGAPLGGYAPRKPISARNSESEGAVAPLHSGIPLPRTEAEEREMLEKAMAESSEEAKRNGFGVQDEDPDNYISQKEFPSLKPLDPDVTTPNNIHQVTQVAVPQLEGNFPGLSAEEFKTTGARPKMVMKPQQTVSKSKGPSTVTPERSNHPRSINTVDHIIEDNSMSSDDRSECACPNANQVPQQPFVTIPITKPSFHSNDKLDNVPILPLNAEVSPEPVKLCLPESEAAAPMWLREALQNLRDRVDTLQELLKARPTHSDIYDIMLQLPPPPWAMHILNSIPTMNQNLSQQQQETMGGQHESSDLSANAREFFPVPQVSFEMSNQSYENVLVPVDQPEMVPVYFAEASQHMFHVPRGMINMGYSMPRAGTWNPRMPMVKHTRSYRKIGRPM